MKSLLGFQAAAAAAALMAMMMMLSADAATIKACPPFHEINDNNECELIPLIQAALHQGRINKRAANNACPYCAQAIWDLYPIWEDCTKFTFCLNGTNVELDCNDLGYQYYNPTTKMCENVPSLTNSCLYRSYSLLNYNPPVTG